MAQASQNSSRAKALARRKAMSSGGKNALNGQGDRTRNGSRVAKPTAAPAASATPAPSAAPAPAASTASYRPRAAAANTGSTSKSAALARRKAMSQRGKSTAPGGDRTRDAAMAAQRKGKVAATTTQPTSDAPKKEGDCGCGCKGREQAAAPAAPRISRTRANKPKIATNPSKAAALARRKAQSTRGKAGVNANGMSEAQTARAANPELTSRELAQALRSARSTRGKVCKGGKCRPTGKVRKQPETHTGAASDQPWKVGASETATGQTVTGTMVQRDEAVTGNEASTCRDVTGTDYMGADVFREFCGAEQPTSPRRGNVASTASGNAVSGNQVGRSTKVTGDEPGTCKTVTGTEYVGADLTEAFCGTAPAKQPMRTIMAETRKGKAVTGDNVGTSEKVTGGDAGADRDLTGTQYMMTGPKVDMPAKVGRSDTLRGGSITGSLVGRSESVTGDEPGACRNVTGDDYVGAEQYAACGAEAPKATDQKVGVSTTMKGEGVTGTMTGRSLKVTGDEPGTCKAVTGTPYASKEQYGAYCEPEQSNAAKARMTQSGRAFGSVMTGQQPGIGGQLTGADKGACEPVTGTPYVGADQAGQACAATAAEPGAPDFPKAIGAAPWGDFSVEPPAHASDMSAAAGNVTGSQYESGHITGPFGMAGGKVTGTEEARFGGDANRDAALPAEPQPEVEGRLKSRITGEGQDAGLKITGDDWERGDHVTGTEGASALARNPSRRGAPMGAMAFRSVEPVEAPQPVSRVTGSSGNTENGSLITYSGGARG